MKDLLQQRGIMVTDAQCLDCGLLIYKSEQEEVQAGGSGTGCSAVVVYGHLLNRLKNQEFTRMLVVATGALHSPLSVQQDETIPCIAHAVSIEMKGVGNL